MSGVDLGIYFVKCTLWDGRGWISRINTGWRFTHGTEETHPIDASPIPPPWKDEEDLISTFVFQYKENNWSCDCNRVLDLARAYQLPEPDRTDSYCLGGPTIQIKKFEILNPRLEVVYFEEPFEPKELTAKKETAEL